MRRDAGLGHSCRATCPPANENAPAARAGQIPGGRSMGDTPATWSEEDSRLYREFAAVIVPDRDEQIATLLALVPFARDEPFRAVELGSGEGRLAFALLDAFPRAAALALDGSAEMRAHATALLRPFGARAAVEPFDLLRMDWLARLDGAD